jgi:hypothetical protein
VTDWDSVKETDWEMGLGSEMVMDSEMETARGQSHVVNHGHLDVVANQRYLCGPHHVVSHDLCDEANQRYLCGPHHVVSHGHLCDEANQRYHQEFQTDWEMVKDSVKETAQDPRRWGQSHYHQV